VCLPGFIFQGRNAMRRQQVAASEKRSGKDEEYMSKKVRFIACLAVVALFLAAQSADAILITFAENDWVYSSTRDQNLSLGPDEFESEGILLTDVYQYIDDRDAFDEQIGIAPNRGSVGTVDFIVPTNSVTVDWWFEIVSIVGGDAIWVEAYDSGDTLLDSFTYTGSASGTDMLDGYLISRIEFYNPSGYEFPAISALQFEPIPEPATVLIVGGLCAGVAGASRLRRRK
jgi:hypothetical protein